MTLNQGHSTGNARKDDVHCIEIKEDYDEKRTCHAADFDPDAGDPERLRRNDRSGGCRQGAAQNEETQDAEGTAAAKIGVVLTTSGLGDNNFNDMVYAGLEKAKEDLGITLITQSPLLPMSTPP